MKLITIALLLITSACFADYPPDTKIFNLTKQPNIPMPGYLQPITDPVFGTQITRISDQTAFGTTQRYLRQAYARIPAWNCDSSKIILSHRKPYYILDGNNYKLIKQVTFLPSEALWSNISPDIVYGATAGDGQYAANTFIKWDVNTDKRTYIRQFKEYNIIRMGYGEGNISNDDKYVAIVGEKSSGKTIMIYDIPKDKIISTLDIGNKQINWCGMSQSGKYLVIGWDVEGSAQYQGIECYNLKMKYLRNLSRGSGIHADMGYDTSGYEVLVYQDDDRALKSRRMIDGKLTEVLSRNTLDWALHISCRNIKRPGWVYISEFSADSGLTSKFYLPIYKTLIAVKLDGSGTVERFAHEHWSSVESYSRQSQAVPNPTGEKVMWASDWEDASPTAPVYAYVAEYKGK